MCAPHSTLALSLKPIVRSKEAAPKGPEVHASRRGEVVVIKQPEGVGSGDGGAATAFLAEQAEQIKKVDVVAKLCRQRLQCIAMSSIPGMVNRRVASCDRIGREARWQAIGGIRFQLRVVRDENELRALGGNHRVKRATHVVESKVPLVVPNVVVRDPIHDHVSGLHVLP